MPPKTVYDHLPPVEKMAAQILDRLYHLGNECSKHDLARRMSAHKKRMWKDAFEMLVRQGNVRLTDMHTRRQILVTLVSIPERLEPRPIMITTKIKRRRPRTQWFEDHLPEFNKRDRYDDGPEEDAIPAPGDNIVEDPSGLPGVPLWRPQAPEQFGTNLAEPPGWRGRHD